jgi:hypothetical protein
MAVQGLWQNGDVTTPFRWIWLNSTVRLAQKLQLVDVNKVGLQLSDGTIWCVTGVTGSGTTASPYVFTWAEVGGAAGLPVTDGTTTIDAGSIKFIGAVVTQGTGSAANVTIGTGTIQSVAYASVSLANGASDTTQTIAVAKVGEVLSVSCSAAGRVRGYTNLANLTADEARATTTTPTPGGGVIFDISFAAAGTQYLAPVAPFLNQDSPVDNLVYLNILNSSGSTEVISGSVGFFQQV